MDNVISYVKNVALIVLGLLTVFIGVGAMLVVLNVISWETLGDWTVKALAIAAIFFAINAVGGLIFSVAKGKDK